MSANNFTALRFCLRHPGIRQEGNLDSNITDFRKNTGYDEGVRVTAPVRFCRSILPTKRATCHVLMHMHILCSCSCFVAFVSSSLDSEQQAGMIHL